jgi:hypothetical protein
MVFGFRSTRMRNRFEREVNYLTKRDALAA